MNVLLTAADSAPGLALGRALMRAHRLAPVGAAAAAALAAYRRVDLRAGEEVGPLLAGVEAIVHVQPYVAALGEGANAEGDLLEEVVRATYVLLQEAIAAGVGRLVLISSLDVLRAHDERFAVTPQWRPRPAATAPALAPYLAELVGREVARGGRIEVVALRFGQWQRETSEAAAHAAVEEALTGAMPRHYHWDLRHVASSGRFAH